MANINISSYFISIRYGYGYHEGGEYGRGFVEPTIVTNPDTNAREALSVAPASRPISFKRRISTGLFSSKLDTIVAPLFIVSDGNDWFEYLTGTCFDSTQVVKSSQTGIYSSFTVFLLTYGNRYSCVDATQFADALSKYSKSELKEIADGVRQRISDAEKWSKNYTELYNKLQQKWGISKTNAEKSLGSNFGKF